MPKSYAHLVLLAVHQAKPFHLEELHVLLGNIVLQVLVAELTVQLVLGQTPKIYLP